MAKQLSQTQLINAVLDKTLDLKLPAMTKDEFERNFGFRVSDEELKGLTLIEVIVRQLVLKACMGNDKSIQEILDRKLGKPVQTAEITTKNFNYYDFLLQLKEKTSIPVPQAEVEPEPEVIDMPSGPLPTQQRTVVAEVVRKHENEKSVAKLNVEIDPLQDLL